MTNTNFLQSTSFKLVINRINYDNLEFFVQSVQHPNVSIQSAEVGYSRIGSVPQPGDKLEFGEITFNLLIDEELAAYTEMYNWMKRLVETKISTNSDLSAVSSTTDISLLILNSANTLQKKFIYRDAFPTNLGDISFEASGGDGVMLLPVSFKYTYFDIV